MGDAGAMSESTIDRSAADRAAIERWESEGGRPRGMDEQARVPGPGGLPGSANVASEVDQIESENTNL